MIIIKKKRLFIFFFIIFLINMFLISKRRDFNFYNLMFIFDNEKISSIDKNLNTVITDHDLSVINLFLKKNKIREVNIDINSLKKNNITNSIEDIIFFFYPIKLNNKSNYIISYHNDNKYNKCKLMLPKPRQDVKLNEKFLTIYLCE
jgi:hypothetical protein